MLDFRPSGFLLGLIVLVCLAQPAAAFGAGNIASISKIEGQNWRHGDIEDALLTLSMAHAIKGGKKFNKMMVSRVYFGNWLRDYSQAIDVGTVKAVSAEAIRLLLCVLGFLTFGYGSDEFEVTAERLGCYRPEDHIDNPKDYADNQDARNYDPRLRGPVNERVELSIDPETGMKNYIANEQIRITTSAGHVRNLFGRCIELGRRYKHQDNKKDLYESLRLMGTGLHCLEDFFAHSNYTELALIEMGEQGVFPHLGSNTQIRLQGARGPVFPIVTGTFGGVDFLHSVTGEVSDKLTQNEIDELEGTLKQGSMGDTSLLRELLDKIPSGIFGGGNQSQKIDEIQSNAATSQMGNVAVSPRDPEQFTIYIRDLYQQIMPVIEFHDSIMKSITSAIEQIPVLPKIIEQLEEQLSVFVFSIIAPFIVPLIHQIRNELQTGSSEIIQSSEKEQHVVFHDDNCTDPTHSMLAKDHFSNILNEIAGRTAAKMLHWVVPQLMEAIDDDSVDINRLLTRIIHGVMHHPAQRDMGNDGVREARQQIFESVREWWGEMDDGQRQDYRRKLSAKGVFNGENHKEGVNDTGHGHGCAGKLKMRKLYGGGPETMEDKIAGAAANAIFEGATGAISGLVQQNTGMNLLPGTQHDGGGDAIGGIISGVAGSLLGGVFGSDETKRETSYSTNNDGSYTRTETEYGQHGNRFGQAEYSQTQHPGGGRETEYRRYEQQENSYGGQQTTSHSYERRTETQQSYGGYSEQRTERREYGSSTQQSYGSSDAENVYGAGRSHGESGYGGEHSSGRDRKSHQGHRKKDSNDSDRSGQSNRSGSHGHKKKHGHKSHESRDSDDSDDARGQKSSGGYGGSSGGYGGYNREETSYGSSHGRREEDSYGSSNYGRQEESSYGGNSDYGRQESSSSGNYGRVQGEQSYGSGYGGRQESSYGGEGGYGGREESSYGGGRQQSGYGNREESGYGSGHQEGSYGGGYGNREESSYRGGRQEGDYGGGYGNREESSYGRRGGGEEYGDEADENNRRGGGGYGGRY